MTAQTILPANSAASGGYDVANSLRFNDGSSDTLTKSFSSSGNRRTWTFSVWFKLGLVPAASRLFSIGNDASGAIFSIFFTAGDLRIEDVQGDPVTLEFRTDQIFRDPSAWSNLVFACDTTQGTNTNRFKIYHNGTQITSFSTETYPGENADTLVNHTTGSATIGARAASPSNTYFDGYMSEVVMIDGQQLAPTSFGEFDSDSGIWRPIDVSGLTFGTNGFYLETKQSGTSANSSGLGADTSGNDHHFTVNNLTAVDQSTDTCTNNFATLNPLSVNSDQGTFSEGNLQLLHASNAFRTGFASIGASQGKWYCEIKRVTATSFAVGVISLDFKSITPNITYMGGVGTPNLGYFRDGNTGVNGSETSGYASYADGDTLMIGLDLDNGKVYFGKNGTWGNSGDPTSGATGTGARSITVGGETWSFGVSVYNATAQCNFGSPPYAISSGNTDGDGFGNFEYAVPSGYFALCTKNLAEHG